MNDDSMHSQPVDLSPLDPTRDAARFTAIAGSITRDAMAARARRAAAPQDIFSELTRWSVPAVLAAAIVLAVALPSLVRTRVAPPALGPVASATDVLGIPPQLMDLVHSPRTPSLSQIDAALAAADARIR